jgi:hypothetical protein
MSAELLQEVTYDAEGRLISFIDFRPCTFTTHYFDEAGNRIADGDAAEDEQADEGDSSCRTYTYEAKDILATGDDWEEDEHAEDYVRGDVQYEMIDPDDTKTGTDTGN